MQERFTEDAKEALRIATDAAYRLSHNYIGTEHLLIGLIGASGVASRVLEEHGVEEDKIIELVNQLIAPNTKIEMVEMDNLTPRAKRIVLLA